MVAGEQSPVPGLGPSSRGSWSRAQHRRSASLGALMSLISTALELGAWEEVQAEPLYGARQPAASARKIYAPVNFFVLLQ